MAELTATEGFKSAKEGNIYSAVQVVDALVTPEQIAAGRAKWGDDVIYLPVHSARGGGNLLPRVLAKRFAEDGHGEVGKDIVQVNRPARRATRSALERFLAPARFDGPIVAGGRYVLTDDVNTLAALADHIQAGGGKVVGITTLVDHSKTGDLTPLAAHTKLTEGNLADVIRKEIGIEPGALTADEARVIAGARTPERLRDSLAAARSSRSGRGDRPVPGVEEGVGEPQPNAEPTGVMAPDQAAGPGEDLHPGLFDDIRGPTDEEAAFEHLARCAPR